MSNAQSQNSRYLSGRVFVLLAVSVILLMTLLPYLRPAESQVAAAPATCGSGVSGNIVTNTTWSGDIYIDGNVNVESTATLTVTPGSRVLFCDNYILRIGDLFSEGRLLALGTAEQPITFTTAISSASTNWDQIYFGDHLNQGPSILRHVVLENAGGVTPAGYAVNVSQRGTRSDYSTPIFENVTARNIVGTAFSVAVAGTNPTPPQLNQVAVHNASGHPFEVDAAAVSGLLAISGTANLSPTVRVRGGTQGTMETDQHWRNLHYPYEVDSSINLSGGLSATWTIDPGVEIRLHPDVNVSVGNLFEPTRLLAQGTPTQSITFTAALTENTGTAIVAQNWGELYFGDHLNEGPSMLEHVVFEHGGGTDTTQGQTIFISSRATTSDYHTPQLNHVSVRQSNGYGLYIEATTSDPKPALLTQVQVEGSSLHPVNVNVNAVEGLGQGFTATNNTTNTIRVFQDEMNFDSHWRNHGLPYEVVAGFVIRSNYSDEDFVPAVWQIDPGVTVLMHPGTGVGVGSLYGEAEIRAIGTADEPITFTRLNETSLPWSGFTWGGFSDFPSVFEHTLITFGGGLSGTRSAVFDKGGSASLTLQNVTLQHSENGAIYNGNGPLLVRDSVLSNNRWGVENRSVDSVQIRNSDLSNNADFAILNHQADDACIDAVGNYWGPGGPSDDSAANDACQSTRTNDGSASVSDGVAYLPWRIAPPGDSAQLPAGGYAQIMPNQFWLLADGQNQADITIKLLDQQGQPLVGKDIQLESTLGTVTQAQAPTNASGETTAHITSTETGYATLTAFNVTDGEPVPGIGGLNFWQGSGDFGGLIDPSGAPYASPDLEVIGKPFQVGFPVEMRLPMQNSRPDPVQVDVVYGVTGLSIGTRFTPVYTAAQSLAPGESWDARGVWVPEMSGHYCIQAAFVYDDGQRQWQSPAFSGSGNRQVNTDQNPCDDLPSGPNDFSPGQPKGGSGDLKTVAKHFKKQIKNLGDAIRCIDDQVTFRSPTQNRDYQTIVTLPDYNPPPLSAGPNLSQAQAEAINALQESTADALALSRGIAATRQRMQWAARADSLTDVDRQYTAYLDFIDRYIATLRTAADQHDDFLAVTEGAGVVDAYYYPEDYQETLNDLRQNGFLTETVAYMQSTGLSDDLIAELQQDIIDRAEETGFQTTSFYQTVRNTRDNARRIADLLELRYDLAETRARNIPAIPGEAQPFDFTVGHQFETTKTVELKVRPVSLPMDWATDLDTPAIELGPGETISNTFTLLPGQLVPEASTVRVAVEGYVDGEYIGGIMFSYEAPVVSGSRSVDVYLPLVLK